VSKAAGGNILPNKRQNGFWEKSDKKVARKFRDNGSKEGKQGEKKPPK